jgi:hypothetical protein
MPQGLLDPDDMGELAFSQEYEEYLDGVMDSLKTSQTSSRLSWAYGQTTPMGAKCISSIWRGSSAPEL